MNGRRADFTASIVSLLRSYSASPSRSSSTKRKSFWSCRTPPPSSSIYDTSHAQSWTRGTVEFSIRSFWCACVIAHIMLDFCISEDGVSAVTRANNLIINLGIADCKQVDWSLWVHTSKADQEIMYKHSEANRAKCSSCIPTCCDH